MIGEKASLHKIATHSYPALDVHLWIANAGLDISMTAKPKCSRHVLPGLVLPGESLVELTRTIASTGDTLMTAAILK